MAVILTSLVLISGIAILFRYYARYKLNYWKRRGVESLPTDLIFGNFKNAALFKTAPGWHLGELHNAAITNSPMLGFYIFHKPCILLRDLKLIKQIMVRDFENFSDRHFAGSQQKDSIGMKNLFGLKNPAWKYVRSKITPTLTKGKLKLMLPLMMEIGESMMEYLNTETTDANGIKNVDAQELNYKYTTDLIASIALGMKFNTFHNPDSEFSKSMSQFYHGIKRMIALVAVFFTPEIVELFGTRVLFNSNFIEKVFWKSMETREKTGIKRGDFIDSLIKLKNEPQNPDYKFEGENLFYQSGTFFSGFESSSTTSSFTLMELAKHSDFQQKAREDINASIEKHGLTYEAFNDMKYLDQCIAEGIRLHPPVSTIDRYTRNDYQIPGTDIVLEKGTAVYISLYGLQQDPRFFENSLDFNPERFNSETNVSDAYIPFGVGPRMCIGMKVGQLHAKVVITMILRRYEVIQLSKDEITLDNRSTFTAAADGINLQFKEIKS
ncbi:cytochrome P450 6k1-like isoform X1 [Leptopilina boulardi]|uniref:cytochrome P450 6k1-like isoform X1 n=1 Tax=Leptopilina boulardi TaxID=63433 RepID=UPI0021F6512C|nr:cytochrome P450 6k1-like isoform X1 [Leptopilina boulardi]